MGYFRANERYLSGGTEAAEVAPPWGVRAGEEGPAGHWRVTWRPPYTPVDSYGVYGQAATDPAGAWQELLRVPGTAQAASLHLGPGGWRLAVAARRGDADSPRVIAECGLRSADYAQGAPPEDARIGAIMPAVPQAPQPTPPVPIPNPQPPTPTCPACGARVAERADGSTGCVYCGCAVAITLDGRALALDRLLYGACTCCVPRRPLIRQGEALVCPAHPERRYGVPVSLGDGRNDGDQTDPTPTPHPPTPIPEPAPELDWTAIDTALRENSARLGRHGLFVRDRR